MWMYVCSWERSDFYDTLLVFRILANLISCDYFFSSSLKGWLFLAQIEFSLIENLSSKGLFHKSFRIIFDSIESCPCHFWFCVYRVDDEVEFGFFTPINESCLIFYSFNSRMWRSLPGFGWAFPIRTIGVYVCAFPYLRSLMLKVIRVMFNAMNLF